MKLYQLRAFTDMVEKIAIENSKMALDLDDAPDEYRGLSENLYVGSRFTENLD